MDRLAELISSKKSTDTILTCGKEIYTSIVSGIPRKILFDGGKIVYNGLEVRLDESKEAGYVEIS